MEHMISDQENRGTTSNKCPRCGEDKAKGESLDKLPGDWRCPRCGANNFSRKTNCFKCIARKGIDFVLFFLQFLIYHLMYMDYHYHCNKIIPILVTVTDDILNHLQV